MIKLYHYSDKDFKGYIDPAFFGSNSYTGNSRRISEVKRAYFYLEPKPLEYRLEGLKFLYIAEVNKNKLYDIDKNILKLDGNQDIYTEIKNKGYIGIFNSKQVVLFKAIKIIKKVANYPLKFAKVKSEV